MGTGVAHVKRTKTVRGDNGILMPNNSAMNWTTAKKAANALQSYLRLKFQSRRQQIGNIHRNFETLQLATYVR